MPVNYQQIKSQIRTWGEKAPQREEKISRLRDTCRQLISGLDDAAALEKRIHAARELSPHLRTASPAGEAPSRCFPLPALESSPLLLAADGSQINPDRHAAVEFCVINVGAFTMQAGAGARDASQPAEYVKSDLLTSEELYENDGLVTEEMVALRRDLKERQFIAELAGRIAPPVVALTDGPLELFAGPELSRSESFRKLFDEYLQVMAVIAEKRVVTAGYVDKPHSDLLVRMLEISQLGVDELDKAGKERRFLGIIDVDLFIDRLQPGERSAVFKIISPSAEQFSGDLALHFFYLNAGRPGSPWITRVEVPAWAACDKAALGMLHAVLIQQCRMLGNAPYPYVLSRAHEVAVVRMPERDMIEGMLQSELLQRGMAPGRQSNKQHHKNHAGRRRQ